MIRIFKKKPAKPTQVIKEYGKIYKSEGVSLQYQSSLLIEEAHSLIGKTIDKVEAGAYVIKLKFTDGSELEIGGFTLNEENRPDSLDTKFTDKTVKI